MTTAGFIDRGTIRRVAKEILVAVSVSVCSAAATASAIPAPVASYHFNDTLSAQQGSAPALVSVDPLGLNGFEDAVVFGQERRVFRWDGNSYPPEEQAGLTLAAAGLVFPNTYSVEMLFEFTEDVGGWRRILDVQDRVSDNGGYVSPASHLQIYENGELAEGTTPFVPHVFYHVVLTVSPDGFINGYVDGALEFTVTTPTGVMNIDNEAGMLSFFLDNLQGGGIGEFADGRVALIRLFGAVLTAEDVASLAQNPFLDACPLTAGFWKNHAESWSVDSLTLGNEVYASEALLELLNLPVGQKSGADASLILARQLIAAKLNIAGGSDPFSAGGLIVDADALLSGLGGRLPLATPPSTSDGQAMIELSGMLDDYNNGGMTPACIPR
jgi:hypothetical protein